MNIDWLNQGMTGGFKDQIWDWMVDVLKDIYEAENAIELMNKPLFALLCFSNVCQFGDTLS